MTILPERSFSTETKANDAATTEDTMKVALCVTGAVNDMGFCQSAYDALVLLEEKYGCEIAYTENVQPADMAAVFTDYAANGYDIVFGHGFRHAVKIDDAAVLGAHALGSANGKLS